MQTTNRLFINSLALYINMGVTMIVTLLSTRYALQALGEEAYGIYILVANITAMLSFLNVAMASATQRFLSFSLGAREQLKELKQIFYSSIILHLCIAAILSVIILGFGIICITHLLDIPLHLTRDTYIVLGSITAGVAFTVIAVPYEAAMNAHEDIYQIASINIIDATLKLLAACSLFLFDSQRLSIYALLIMCVSSITYLLKRSFSRRHYAECRYNFGQKPPRQIMQSILCFASWNLVGNGASIFRYQGTAIVLNTFFGVIVNVAYGIAQQVNAFLMFFANSVIRPFRPLIVKAEGHGDREHMLRLSFSMTKLTMLMMALAVTPLYINMPFILHLWLGEVPPHTIDFCRLFLLITLVLQSSMGLISAIESEGHIKWLNLSAGLLHFLPIPIGYSLFRAGYPPFIILIVVLLEEILATLVRLFIANKQIGLSARKFLLGLLLPSYCVLLTAFSVTRFISTTLPEGWLRFIVSGIIHTTLALALYIPILSSWERKKIANVGKSAIAKILHRH